MRSTRRRCSAHDPGWLDALFKSAFFPVPYERLPNRPRVEVVGAGRLDVPGFAITALPLNHPGGCLAYRIRGVPTATWSTPRIMSSGIPAFDEPLAEFVAGAAAVVLDAHFTPEERPHLRGLGPQRLAPVRGVRRRQGRRRPLAVPSQARPPRQELEPSGRRPANLPAHRDRGGEGDQRINPDASTSPQTRIPTTLIRRP